MRILITGATGAMAFYLAKYIKTTVSDCRISGISRKTGPGDVAEWLDDYRQCDLAAQPMSSLAELIGYINPDIIFHLAALANVSQSFSFPQRFFTNNVDGTLNLFKAIVKTNIRPRFIHCSTSEVYGDVSPERNPIKESEPFAPVNFYAMSKAAQELVCQTFSAVHGIDLVITRAFGYINPRRADLVATSLASQIVAFERGDRKAVFHGDLKPIRSFCDAREIAEAYWLAATVCKPGVYNIGSEMPCSIWSLKRLLEAVSGIEVKYERYEGLLRTTDIFQCYPDTNKFIKATGWYPKIQLSESLKWLMECVRK